jgi:integrase/recombinase XerC
MTRERYLSDAELAAFMAAVRGRTHVHQRRDYAFFALLANTGIRPSEGLALTRGDTHAESDHPWIRIWRMKKKKAIPEFDDLQLTPGVAAVVKAHLANVAMDGATRLFELHRRAASRLFHYYASEAGITRRAHLYILRHTAATRLYRETRDIHLVQSLLGHEKPDTTAIYAHIPRSVMDEMHTRIPPII